jgi:hypothetical protein
VEPARALSGGANALLGVFEPLVDADKPIAHVWRIR